MRRPNDVGAVLQRLADVPVAPGAARARDLARRELADRAYRDAQPGLLERGVRAVLDALSGVRLPSASAPVRLAAVVVVLLALLAVAVLVVRGTRRARRTGARGTGPVLVDTSLTAGQLRAAADAAAAQERWADAVAMRFRALVRALQERDLLDTSPGLTAGEAAAAAERVLARHAAALRAGAALFDGVVYGGRGAAEADADRLRALDRALEGSRPQHAPAGAPPTAPAPAPPTGAAGGRR